jgi:ubiquinone/menaquinone biosynthesis C-methylase UbiE
VNTKEGIARAYDLASESYAQKFWNELDSKHFDRLILGWFAGQAPKDQKILEIGCGPGEVSGFLAGLGASCIGTDISPRMIDNARRYFPGVEFQVRDFFSLGFADGSFTRAVAFYAIVNLTQPEVESALREVRRVLAPGGLFLFTFHVQENEDRTEVADFLAPGNALTFYYFKVDEMKAAVERLGYRVVDILVRHPYPGVEYQSKRAYFIVKKA